MPIHLIWGDDISAIDRKIKSLIQETINPNWLSINLSRFNGQNPDQAIKALEEVRTPPFGDGNRIVVVQKSSFCNGCSPELSIKFETTVDLIPDKTHLILSNSNKPDGRLKTTKLINVLKAQNKAFESSFVLPAIWDEIGQKRLIQRTANEMNIELEEDAIYALIEALGNDSKRIELELQKLVLLEETKNQYTELKKVVISEKTVHDLIDGISTNSLKICDQFLSENWKEAILQIDSLLNKGEPALKMVASFATQIRGWLWVSLLEKEKPQDINFIAKQAGIANPKRIYIIRKQIKGKTSIFFIDLLSKILEIEALLKKGASPKNAFRDGLLTIH